MRAADARVAAAKAWLVRPLDRAMRSRLEVCLGVVLSAASVVALSTVIVPDPSKLAASTVVVPDAASIAERRAEARLYHPEPTAEAKLSPEFAAAVARGDLATMGQLYTKGMSLDGALSVAAEAGKKGAALWLLDRGADVHEEESTVNAPVLVGDGYPDLVALLIARGAAEPSLATAAQACAPNAVVRLLAEGAEVNPTDASPLHDAISTTRGTPELRRLIVDKLVDAGADPNTDVGESPLVAAVSRCDRSRKEHSLDDCLPIMKLLVKHGAAVKGETLIAALALDEWAQGKALDVLLTTRLEPGATATALAQGFAVQPHVVKRLVAKGVDWGWHNGEDDEALPLITAAERGDRDFVRALLDVGAPVDMRTKSGRTALGVAIDATAASGSGGGSPDHARVIELLVARGADVNRRFPDGRTPLYAAAESGDIRVINALLERGARVNEVVLDSLPIDAAEQYGHEPAARVLHAHGGRRARKSNMGD